MTNLSTGLLHRKQRGKLASIESVAALAAGESLIFAAFLSWLSSFVRRESDYDDAELLDHTLGAVYQRVAAVGPFSFGLNTLIISVLPLITKKWMFAIQDYRG